MSKCVVCNEENGDTRYGVCFDCATEGDLRLGARTVREHLAHAWKEVWTGDWWVARLDVKCAWERLWRIGEYAPGRDWEEL